MTIKQEIFAVGVWNKMPFTLADLKKMAAAFMALASVQDVPLKLGHNEKQAVTDGQPALGKVVGMSVDENSTPPKLVAEFDHVPPIVEKAFDKKLYRNVSIELDFGVKHKGVIYDFVVTAVALLGADIPAVNVLNDLGKLMTKNSELAHSGYAAASHATFTTITGSIGVSTMTPEEEAKLIADLAAAKAANVTLSAEFKVLKDTSEEATKTFAADKEKREKAELADKITAARLVFTTMLEKAVTDKAITPAQREAFTKALRLDDDAAVLLVKEEDVKALFSAEDDAGKFSKSSGKDDDEDGHDDPGQDLTTRTYAHMEKTGEKDFTKSLFTVMKANPDLAAEYVNSNGEVKH